MLDVTAPIFALDDNEAFVEAPLVPQKHIDLARRAGTALEHEIARLSRRRSRDALQQAVRILPLSLVSYRHICMIFQ